jgi:hypothetical protein
VASDQDFFPWDQFNAFLKLISRSTLSGSFLHYDKKENGKLEMFIGGRNRFLHWPTGSSNSDGQVTFFGIVRRVYYFNHDLAGVTFAFSLINFWHVLISDHLLLAIRIRHQRGY